MNRNSALCAALAALISGCGMAGQTPSQDAAARPAWWREAPAASRPGVYVTQANGGDDGVVYGYPSENKANKPPLCSIGGQKFSESGIASDAKGNVYLPNVETGGVAIYSPNCGSLLATVNDPYGSDIDVALHKDSIFAAGGTHVAVCSLHGCANELTDSSIHQIGSVAVDSAGNVWASYFTSKGSIELIVWRHAKMPGQVVSGYVNQNTPGSLLFDNKGTLLSVQTRFIHLYEYRCDAAKASCSNTQTFTLQGGSLFGALNAKNTDFQATDYENDSVDVYTYPGLNYEYSYSNGLSKSASAQGITQVSS